MNAQRDCQGLTSKSAQKQLQKDGPNILSLAPNVPWHSILLRQFSNAMVVILVVAALIALSLQEYLDAAAILVILIFNAVLGFAQEWKAEKTLSSLKAVLPLKTIVKRDGREEYINAELLVRGDLVSLKQGDKVPADIVLSDAQSLKVDESILTGESFSIEKIRHEDLFAGTSVTQGRCEGIIVATGMHTSFGQVADLTATTQHEPTSLQKSLARLGRALGVFSLLLALNILVFGMVAGRDISELVLTGLSLAVAVVPEGLPAVVTVTLALGAAAMVKRNALSRRLQATETLGATSTICSDKTGTLTENEMTLVNIWQAGGTYDVHGTGYSPAGQFKSGDAPIVPTDGTHSDLVKLLKTGLICNHSSIDEVDGIWVKIGEPTEAAFVTAALKAKISSSDDDRIVKEVPFSSERKRMSVLAATGGQSVVHSKGAPEAILEICTCIIKDGETIRLDEKQRCEIFLAYEQLASKGLRVLALARKELAPNAGGDTALESDLVFLGLAGLIDPPRPEVRDSISKCHKAGIDVIMITGDAPKTALAIADMLGMRAQHAVTGPQIDSMDDSMLMESIYENVVFARTTPQHKIRIVQTLQNMGKIVAMTGDGVNDAPALKKANIGVAMGVRGTEVSKDAADIVLLDDNFSTIVHAIEEGRRQYQNIRKFVRYLLSSNAGEVVAIVGSIAIAGPLIFLPIQILWMNLVTDGLTALTLALEKSEPDTMKQKPREADENILDKDGILVIACFALYTGSASLFVFYWVLPMGVVYAQTAAFTTMIFLEKFSVLAFRSIHLPTRRIGFFSNRWLLVALSLTLGAQFAAVYWPPLQAVLHTTALNHSVWAMIGLVVLPIVLVPEALKIRWDFISSK